MEQCLLNHYPHTVSYTALTIMVRDMCTWPGIECTGSIHSAVQHMLLLSSTWLSKLISHWEVVEFETVHSLGNITLYFEVLIAQRKEMLPTLNFKGYWRFVVGVEETALWSKPSEQCSVWGWIKIRFINCAFDRSVSGKSGSPYQCSFTMWDDSNNAPTRSVGVWCFAVKFMLTFHQFTAAVAALGGTTLAQCPLHYLFWGLTLTRRDYISIGRVYPEWKGNRAPSVVQMSCGVLTCLHTHA